tara:strand:- start:3562 stop:4116 length:555 start_codon:yes stop_codon:yes gene_type:complete
MKLGEWWIQDQWSVVQCDGDIGDLHHECVVLERAISELVDEINLWVPSWELRDDYEGDYHALREDLCNQNCDDYEDFLIEKGVDRKTFDRALNMNQDHRLVGMRDYNWHAVREDRVDTWCLSRKSMKIIGEGLLEIADQEGIDIFGTEFTIEDFGTRKLYRALTSQLLEGKVTPYASCQPISSL